MPKHFTYGAFLSYSPVNAGVAGRVGRRLEQLRIDRGPVRRPARVGPVFRDRCEIFARACLGGETVAALADSAALIVLASPHSAQSMQWKIKRFSNDELRQRFIDVCAEQVKILGMTLPDSELKWNEEQQHYDFGPIDWSEFYQVISGNGPCNKERLAARVQRMETFNIQHAL